MAKIRNRQYTLNPDGSRKPSVTEVLGKNLGWKAPALYAYFYNRGKKGEPMNAHRDEAASRGSCAHALVAFAFDKESDLSSWRDDQIEEARPNADRVVAEIKRRRWEVIYVEEAIESEAFVGTIDMAVRDEDGVVHLVDLKTSAGVYPEHVVQVGGYSWLHRQWCARNDRMADVATTGAIIHAPFGGDLQVQPISAAALVAGEQAFRLLLQLHEITPQIKLGDAA